MALKSQAQRTNSFKIIGENERLKVKVIRRLDNKFYYLIRKNNGKSDSLLISKSQTLWEKDTCIINQIQLNKIGASEIILESIQGNQLETQSNSSFSTLQIWDWDKQSLLFNATKKWYSEITMLSNNNLDINNEPTMNTCICEGSYDIEILDNANLMIKNLLQRAVNTEYCETDHQEGIYTLSEGKYKIVK